MIFDNYFPSLPHSDAYPMILVSKRELRWPLDSKVFIAKGVRSLPSELLSLVEECVKLFHAHLPKLLRDKEAWYHSYQCRRNYEA